MNLQTVLSISHHSKRIALFLAIAVSITSPTAHAVTVDMVTVGNPGNAPDTRYDPTGTGFGSVNHVYQIGKYEVTAGQYTEFLNAVADADPNGLYNTYMSDPSDAGPYLGLGANIQRAGSSGTYTYSVAADWANRPVNYVSFWDAARFANWLHNGQPTGPQGPGTTEGGAYHDIGDEDLFGRNAGATFFIPTIDEWYKAAYQKNDGVTGNYWDLPTASNTAPINTLPDPGNHANFFDSFSTGNNGFTIGSPYYRTKVGDFSNSPSPYGTFDQGGNVREWNETELEGAGRVLRGGSFASYNTSDLAAPYLDLFGPQYEYFSEGFRVASIPELPGDFNHDGTVDSADYVVWRKNPGGIYTPDDYNTWRAHFGQTFSFGSGAAVPSAEPLSPAVPEPATVFLLLSAAAGVSSRRSRTA